MEDFQKAVKLAAKIREESWNDGLENYNKSIAEAAYEAANEFGYADGSHVIYLLLKNCWNDVLDWANNKY